MENESKPENNEETNLINENDSKLDKIDNHSNSDPSCSNSNNQDSNYTIQKNLNEQSNQLKIDNEEDLFCMPAPVLPQSQSHSNPKPTQLAYLKPDWSSSPPECLGENQLDDEGYCNHYYLEVIKNGTVLEKISLSKEFTSFGRSDTCDILCEHPTLSRFHAILQYSNGELDSKHPQGFYIYDLNSTHATILNKTKIKPNEYTPINVDSIIKFGQSTRIYVLHGPKLKNTSDDLNINLTHEQMKQIKEKYAKISMKLKIRKEIEEEEEMEHRNTIDKDKGVDWGIKDELDEENQDEARDVNPFAEMEQVDDSYYSSDPKKALKNFFDREGEELEYEVEELGPGKYKCRIRLPIENKFGEPIYAECQHEGRKKETMTICALEACRILNSEGVLRQSRHESARKKREKDWESADFYDSDEDTFLDRTGGIEKKRLKRMAQAGKLDEHAAKALASSNKNKVHTFDSLQFDLKALFKEQNEMEKKLEKCKNLSKAIVEDDVDSYIQSLKQGSELDTITRAKFRRRLVEIKQEILKLEKLIQVAKPVGFELDKWKESSINELNVTIVSSKNEEKPVEIEVKEQVIVEETIPEIVIQVDKKQHENKVDLKEYMQIKKPLPKENLDIEKFDHEQNTQNSKAKRKKIAMGEEQSSGASPYEAYHKDYAMWLPPENQSGDGKTKLNEKYGY